MRSSRVIVVPVIVLTAVSFFVACGGGGAATQGNTPSGNQPAGSATTVAVNDTSSSPPPTTSGSPPPAAANAANAADAGAKGEWHDPGPKTLEPKFGKSAPHSMFPKATVGDHECWQGLGLTGSHDQDYASLIAKCGAPTGLAEYVAPVTGKIHHKHKRRDVYKLHLEKGLCYRYFAVGDSTISDLDILVLRNGALIADDKTVHPVAIIEGDKPWCMDHDEQYDFSIEVEGPGTGRYTFGVWAKPKS